MQATRRHGEIDDPNYYKHHCIIGHSIQKCFLFKDHIMKLGKERMIDLDTDEVVGSNHTTISCALVNDVLTTLKQGQTPLELAS